VPFISAKAIQPAQKIRVQFIPDIEKGTKGPASTADTDADGKFRLECRVGDQSRPGAVVGWHRVVLSDLRLAESASGAGVPIRVPVTYMLASSTPLGLQVREINDKLVIEIPKSP
jgi:hypothetical protein